VIRAVLSAALAVLALTGEARADPPRAPPAAVTATATNALGVVNINDAGAEELVRLPGVGPARADAIVNLRGRVRRFNHAEDLLRVRGIGRVGFRRMRPFVTLSGPTTLTSRPPRVTEVR
jgi:competence protein ComEA